MITTNQIKTKDFDYNLPVEKIALKPLRIRSKSKLLVYKCLENEISHNWFEEIDKFIEKGSLIIANDTKVIKARIPFRKSNELNAEIFLLEPKYPSTDTVITLSSKGNCSWICMTGNLSKKQLKEVYMIHVLEQELKFTFTKLSNDIIVNFEYSSEITFSEILENIGKIPLPPYIKRELDNDDAHDYQTVYAENDGAVAAPTAGLHFTDDVLKKLIKKDSNFQKVTLHVSAGTFIPVKTENITNHKMHSEKIIIPIITIEKYIETIKKKGKVYFVGTTTLRTLESMYWFGTLLIYNLTNEFVIHQSTPYDFKFVKPSLLESFTKVLEFLQEKNYVELRGETSLMIIPTYKINTCDGLITNFHQPQSTLLMLIESMLGGTGKWRMLYEYALINNYRFLSYGDSCLIIR